MNLIPKTIIKLIISIILLSLFFIGCITAFSLYVDTVHGIVYGGILLTTIIGLIIAFIFPIIFADYIKYFWKKEEEKNAEKKRKIFIRTKGKR